MAKTRKPVADSTATDDTAAQPTETTIDPAVGESAAPEPEPVATPAAETVADPVVAEVAPSAPTIDPEVPLDEPAEAAPVEIHSAAEPSIRVVAPAGPRWRGGLQFGREPVTLGAVAIEEAAAAKGMSPEAFVALLRAAPLLSVS